MASSSQKPSGAVDPDGHAVLGEVIEQIAHQDLSAAAPHVQQQQEKNEMKKKEEKQLSLAARAIHAGDHLNSHHAVAPPMHVSTTFRYSDDPDKLAAWDNVNVRGPPSPSRCFVHVCLVFLFFCHSLTCCFLLVEVDDLEPFPHNKDTNTYTHIENSRRTRTTRTSTRATRRPTRPASRRSCLPFSTGRA